MKAFSATFTAMCLIALFELRRTLSTTRGLLALVGFAFIWYLLLAYPVRMAAATVEQGMSSGQTASLINMIGLGSLMQWDIPEFAVIWRISLWVFPMMCLSLCADQTASDRERGTLRILSCHTSRDSIFFGRYLGFLLLQFALILFAVASTVALVFLRNTDLLIAAIDSSLIIITNMVIILLPFTAMMALLSALVKSPRQATIFAVLLLVLATFLMYWGKQHLPALELLRWIIPGSQLSALGDMSDWRSLQLAYIPLIQSIAYLSLGRWLFHRNNL